MDLKVCGKLLTHHRRGYGVDVEALRDLFPLRRTAGPPEKAPTWDLMRTEGCGGGIRFSWCSWMFRGTWIYIGGRSRAVEPRGAHEGGGAPTPWVRPPTSSPPRCFLDVHSKSPRLHLFEKRLSRRFHSIWTLFDIPFLRNTVIGKKTAICTGPSVNRLVPKII